MLTFLFWNIRRRPLQEFIAELVEAYEVDILLLAESDVAVTDMIQQLDSRQGARFHYPTNPSERIAIYTRFNPQWMRLILDEDGLSIRLVNHPLYGELLIVAAHLPSRRHRSLEELNVNTVSLRGHIERAEERIGHTRTLIVGDINLDPFDSGVTMSEGLHGVMDRDIAERESRIVRGHNRQFFYNPMWSRLGDESPGPPGTYYYNSSTEVNYFWHTFDQVLLRPDLLPHFHNNDLEIISEFNSRSLLTLNGLPDTNIASDHLPLTFKLRF